MAAGERTEAATPRRLHELRSQGRVPKSGDLQTGIALLAGFGLLHAFGGTAVGWLGWYLQRHLAALGYGELTEARVAELSLGAGLLFATVMAPVLLLPVVGTVASMGQGGIVLSSQLVDGDRINPLSGFRRLFSVRSAVELLKTLAKAAIVFLILARTYTDNLPELLALSTTDLRVAAPHLAEVMIRLGLIAGFALLVLGGFDYAYQRWEFNRNAKMTKEELRQDIRETEGSPELRARFRQIQRKMAMGRMMHRVASADVVVTNPTHFAVALVYRGSDMRAPEVVAKGMGLVAERIKELARTHGVPVVENQPLAQALYRSVEIGQQIPETLFEAVAQVLAYVYSLSARARGEESDRG